MCAGGGRDKGSTVDYTTKLLISGNVIEFYKYSRVYQKNYKKDNGEFPQEKEEKEEVMGRKTEYRISSQIRRRNNIRRLALTNFNDDNLFITLTFRDGSIEDVKNVKQATTEFNCTYTLDDTCYVKYVTIWKMGKFPVLRGIFETGNDS